MAERHSRPARLTAALAAAVLLGAGGLLSVAGPAAADDPQGLTASVSQAKAELNQLQDQTEQVAEKMNAARIAQAGADRRAAAAQARLATVNRELSGLQARVGTLALRSFEASTDRALALLGSSDPAAFLVRASDMAQVSRNRAEALDSLKAARKRQTDARTAAATAVTERTKITEQVAAEQAQVARSLARQQALLQTLQDRQAELVRQAELAAARADAARQAAAQQALEEARAEQQRLAQAAAAAAAAVAVPAPPVSAPVAAAPAPAAVASTPVEAPAAPARSGDAAGVAIAEARAQMGKPYVYGAAGPNTFDCSGLTQWAYAKAGISLAHYTGAQWNQGRHVSRGELQPGDLVFFYGDLHHVGLYVGGGMMIDAPHTGAVVREEPLFDEYAGAVRPTG